MEKQVFSHTNGENYEQFESIVGQLGSTYQNWNFPVDPAIPLLRTNV